jgi:hypothetical protein
MAIFFAVREHGYQYECRIDTKGPRVFCNRLNAQFGTCSLRPLGSEPSWYIVTHEDERAIELPWATTSAAALELGTQLGIALWYSRITPKLRADAFYDSPAFDALRTWVEHHPIGARGFAKDPVSRRYLPDWYERSLAPPAPPARPREVARLRLVHSR